MLATPVGDWTMSDFIFVLFRNNTKKNASYLGDKLSEYRELCCQGADFNDYHEFRQVLKSNPADVRLEKAVLNSFRGIDEMEELVTDADTFQKLIFAVDDVMSGPMAETNAEAYGIENLEISDFWLLLDDKQLGIQISFEYNGDQMDGRAYAGSSFSVDVDLYFQYHGNKWHLDEFGDFDYTSETDRESYYV